MSYRYAQVLPDADGIWQVIEERTYPEVLPADAIKHIWGLATLRPLVEGDQTVGLCHRLLRYDYTISETEVARYAVTEPLPIGEARIKGMAEVDRQAETRRLNYLTPGAGQAQEYAQTEAEAEAALASSAADFTGRPWLRAERNAQVEAAGGDPANPQLGPTVLEIAAEVVAQRDAWISVGAAIKRVRRRAKLEIAAATTADAVESILAGLIWPT